MLVLKNISFSYTKKPFIKNLNLRIAKGETISLIGASGCGKSTLLQLIYGLHHVEGTLSWNDRQLLGPNFNLVPGEEFIKYLTQDFDLMPSISVAENIGKFLSNAYPRKKQQRVKQLLELVEMKELMHTKAKYLSGGQQQRVALARVLAKEPEILLLDEPFSHIDHFRKNKLRRNLFAYLKQQQITCLVATHDATDALSFADRTLVMKAGKIIAQGSPQELYQQPKNAYVASLFGEINEWEVGRGKELIREEVKEGKGDKMEDFGERHIHKGKVILYPHEIHVEEASPLRARVKNSYFKGSVFLIAAEFKGREVFFEHPTALEQDMEVGLKIMVHPR